MSTMWLITSFLLMLAMTGDLIFHIRKQHRINEENKAYERTRRTDRQRRRRQRRYAHHPDLLDHIETIRELGRGQDGEVYLGRDGQGDEVILKALRPRAGQEVYMAQELMDVDHPNVVRIFGVDVANREIFMEPLQGDVRAAMRHNNRHYTEHQTRTIMGQLLAGVRALHDHGIVHADLRNAFSLIF